MEQEQVYADLSSLASLSAATHSSTMPPNSSQKPHPVVLLYSSKMPKYFWPTVTTILLIIIFFLSHALLLREAACVVYQLKQDHQQAKLEGQVQGQVQVLSRGRQGTGQLGGGARQQGQESVKGQAEEQGQGKDEEQGEKEGSQEVQRRSEVERDTTGGQLLGEDGEETVNTVDGQSVTAATTAATGEARHQEEESLQSSTRTGDVGGRQDNSDTTDDSGKLDDGGTVGHGSSAEGQQEVQEQRLGSSHRRKKRTRSVSSRISSKATSSSDDSARMQEDDSSSIRTVTSRAHTKAGSRSGIRSSAKVGASTTAVKSSLITDSASGLRTSSKIGKKSGTRILKPGTRLIPYKEWVRANKLKALRSANKTVVRTASSKELLAGRKGVVKELVMATGKASARRSVEDVGVKGVLRKSTEDTEGATSAGERRHVADEKGEGGGAADARMDFPTKVEGMTREASVADAMADGSGSETKSLKTGGGTASERQGAGSEGAGKSGAGAVVSSGADGQVRYTKGTLSKLSTADDADYEGASEEDYKKDSKDAATGETDEGKYEVTGKHGSKRRTSTKGLKSGSRAGTPKAGSSVLKSTAGTTAANGTVTERIIYKRVTYMDRRTGWKWTAMVPVKTGTRSSKAGGKKKVTSGVQKRTSFTNAVTAGGPTKVAFLFLIRRNLPHAALWEKFFQGHEGKYSIYIQASPKIDNETIDALPSIFHGRFLSRFWTGWGTMEIVAAERRLVMAALNDTANTHFALVSESCIPLWSLPSILNRLSRANVSYLEAYQDPFHTKSHAFGRRYVADVHGRRFNSSQLRKGSQWFILNRLHAEMFAMEKSFFRLFINGCKKQKERGFYNCCADEHYLQTFLTLNDPTGISYFPATFADWRGRKLHPRLFTTKSATRQLIKAIKAENRYIMYRPNFSSIKRRYPHFYLKNVTMPPKTPEYGYCSVRGKLQNCFLFARKFSRSTTDFLVQNSEALFGF